MASASLSKPGGVTDAVVNSMAVCKTCAQQAGKADSSTLAVRLLCKGLVDMRRMVEVQPAVLHLS
jgi:hypothetical protein